MKKNIAYFSLTLLISISIVSTMHGMQSSPPSAASSSSSVPAARPNSPVIDEKIDFLALKKAAQHPDPQIQVILADLQQADSDLAYLKTIAEVDRVAASVDFAHISQEESDAWKKLEQEIDRIIQNEEKMKEEALAKQFSNLKTSSK